jgi:hypothetical protein
VVRQIASGLSLLSSMTQWPPTRAMPSLRASICCIRQLGPAEARDVAVGVGKTARGTEGGEKGIGFWGADVGHRLLIATAPHEKSPASRRGFVVAEPIR